MSQSSKSSHLETTRTWINYPRVPLSTRLGEHRAKTRAH